MVLAVNPPLSGQTSASFQESAKTAKINRPAPPSLSSSSEPSKTSTGSGTGSTGSSSNSGNGGGSTTTGINGVLAFGAFLLALM